MAWFRRAATLLICLLVSIIALNACSWSTPEDVERGNSIQIVAAENFYGDVAQQIGGSHVQITSLLSDPNVDPHSYESSVHNAKLVARARLIIENGGGYDDWMDKLLASSPSENRSVLQGFTLAPHRLPNNEHVWYSIDNM